MSPQFTELELPAWRSGAKLNVEPKPCISAGLGTRLRCATAARSAGNQVQSRRIHSLPIVATELKDQEADGRKSDFAAKAARRRETAKATEKKR